MKDDYVDLILNGREPNETRMKIKDEAHYKYLEGVKKRGEINLKTDKRNFVTEALEELIDAHNYITWAKIPKFAKRFILLILGMMYDILLNYE